MTDWPHVTTFSLTYETPERAVIVARSLEREVGAIDDDRSRTAIDLTDTTVELTVRAADLTALRAAMNTWLGLATVAERVQDATAR